VKLDANAEVLAANQFNDACLLPISGSPGQRSSQ